MEREQEVTASEKVSQGLIEEGELPESRWGYLRKIVQVVTVTGFFISRTFGTADPDSTMADTARAMQNSQQTDTTLFVAHASNHSVDIKLPNQDSFFDRVGEGVRRKNDTESNTEDEEISQSGEKISGIFS